MKPVEIWARLCRMAVVVRGLLGPTPWRWGHVEILSGGPELHGLGCFRLELVHGQTWVRTFHLQRSGKMITTCTPAYSVIFFREMSEDEVRRRLLPDPAEEAKPCEKMVSPSCRPGLCAWCGFNESAHEKRDIAQAADPVHALRTRIAQVLKHHRGHYLGWDDVIVTLDGAAREDAPGEDRVRDVALRRRPEDWTGERITREEWDLLMNDGLPLFPWSQASQTWGPPDVEETRHFQRRIAYELSAARGCRIDLDDVILTFDGAAREEAPGRDRVLDVALRRSPMDRDGERITRDEWTTLVGAGLPLFPWERASKTWGTGPIDGTTPRDETSL